ncbi:MAG TPA: hypothetical protein VKU77_25235 [Streptosporangiaceae bacterium]|nr:hypothetical protein [Streptosporangiaceae bacterium]
MAHAIEMFFDEHADAEVRTLWSQLATAGLPSLAHPDPSSAPAPRVADSDRGAVVTRDLLTLHTQVHNALTGQTVTHWPFYLPGRWVPHCTLAQGLSRDELSEAFRLLHGYQPIAVQVTSAGITDTVTGAITPLTS